MTKHQTVTIFMVPFLALVGYILADIYADSTDDISKNKKLVVSNTCKPLKQQCEILGLGTDRLKLSLVFGASPSYQRLLPISLVSEKNLLDDISISLLIDGKEMPPIKMTQGVDKMHWNANLMPFAHVTQTNLRIRLTVSYKSALHFAEFPIIY